MKVRRALMAALFMVAVPFTAVAQMPADPDRATGPEAWVAFEAEVDAADALFADIRDDLAAATTREEQGLLYSALYVAIVDHMISMDAGYLWDGCYAQFASARWGRLFYESMIVADVLRMTATLTDTELAVAPLIVERYSYSAEKEATTRVDVSCAVSPTT